MKYLGFLFCAVLLSPPVSVFASGKSWVVMSPETMFPPINPTRTGVNRVGFYTPGQDRKKLMPEQDGYLAPTEVVRALKAMGETDPEKLDPRFVLYGPKISESQLSTLINSNRLKVYSGQEEAEAHELKLISQPNYEFKLKAEKCVYTSRNYGEAVPLDVARQVNPQIISSKTGVFQGCGAACGGQVICVKKRKKSSEDDGIGYVYEQKTALCESNPAGACPSATECNLASKSFHRGTYSGLGGPENYHERDWNYEGREAEVYRLPHCKKSICLAWVTKEKSDPVDPKILKEMSQMGTSDGPWSQFANSGFDEKWVACAADLSRGLDNACPALASDCVRSGRSGARSLKLVPASWIGGMKLQWQRVK